MHSKKQLTYLVFGKTQNKNYFLKLILEFKKNKENFEIKKCEKKNVCIKFDEKKSVKKCVHSE